MTMKEKVDIIRLPEECGHRYDASSYPGGEWLCRKKGGSKCPNEHDFPSTCPLMDASAEMVELVQAHQLALVVWVISHPGTGERIECSSFREAYEKWFEGFNPPRMARSGVTEPLEDSLKRVKEYQSSSTFRARSHENGSVLDASPPKESSK